VRRLFLIGLLLLVATGCSEPPQKEIDQAQTAVDLARAAGAERYATEEYAAAVSGLQKAGAAVDQRDYRQALSYAIDARQRAQNAIRQAGDGKARAQRATEALLTGIVTRATQLDTRLKAAEAARVPAKVLRGLRAAVEDVRKDLQEARTDIGAGNYEKAGELLASVRKKLDAAIADVEKISQRPPRHR
jgi:Domain of unknown function (DUF4398)